MTCPNSQGNYWKIHLNLGPLDSCFVKNQTKQPTNQPNKQTSKNKFIDLCSILLKPDWLLVSLMSRHYSRTISGSKVHHAYFCNSSQVMQCKTRVEKQVGNLEIPLENGAIPLVQDYSAILPKVILRGKR